MNKYIIPICDIQGGHVWNVIIMARTRNECQEKLMQSLIAQYELFDDTLTYREFVEEADKKDILIGDIKDIEEL